MQRAPAVTIGLALLALSCGGEGGVSQRTAEAVGSWLEGAQAERGHGGGPTDPPAAAHEAGSAPEAGPEADDGGVPVRVYYRYVDAGGSLHFVERRDQIPAGARAGAERIEVRQEPRAAASRRAAPADGAGPAWLRTLSQPDPPRPAAARVVIYTTPWCGWCRRARSFLDERGVAYVDKDIEADDGFRRELIRKTGRVSVPVIEIDGELVRGFDARALEALL